MITCTPREVSEHCGEAFEVFNAESVSLARVVGGLPDVQYADAGGRDNVPFAVYGNLDVPNHVIETTPYLMRLAPHFRLRLLMHQLVLGPDYCVIGAHPYEPGVMNKAERCRLAAGDFSPITERLLRVMDALPQTDHQLLPYGYSMGGDVAAQLAYDVYHNPNRGVAAVSSVGVAEAARVENRGAYRVVQAMTASGDDLYRNVSASQMPALLEAWGTTGLPRDRGSFDRGVMRGAVAYLFGGLRDNLQIIRGFGTNQTAVQLGELLRRTEVRVFLSREEFSEVLPHTTARSIHNYAPDRVTLHIGMGDHSVDDNLRTSAERILYFARTASATKD